MSHNEVHWTWSSFSTEYRNQWNPSWVPGTGISGTFGLSQDVRPDVVRNAVRPDGTRPVSAWFNRFGNAVAQSRLFHMRYTDDIGQWSEYRWSAPRTFGPAWYGYDTLIADLGAGWIIDQGSFPYEAEARARTKFLSELSGRKAELGTFLGEMRETVDSVERLSQSVLNGLDLAVAAYSARHRGSRKLDPRRADRDVSKVLRRGKVNPHVAGETAKAARERIATEKVVLDAWLTHQFFVRPLVNDVDELGQELSRSLNDESEIDPTLTIRCGAQVESVHRKAVPGAYWPGLHLQHEGRTQQLCHISCVYEALVNSSARRLNQLGVAALPVFWELSRFSWAVDYVFQVGDWLNSLTANNGVQFREGTITRVQYLNQGLSRFKSADPRISIIQGDQWTSSVPNRLGKMAREVLTNGVHPAYRPTVRNKLNLDRLANVLSVLALRAG